MPTAERSAVSIPKGVSETGPPSARGEERCLLAEVRGRVESCPRGACAYWEAGGAALAGSCLLRRAGLDLQRRPQLVRLLEKIRRTLEQPETPAAEAQARAALGRLLGFGRDADPE